MEAVREEEVMYHAWLLTSTPEYQSAHDYWKWLASLIPKIWLEQNLEKSHVTMAPTI